MEMFHIEGFSLKACAHCGNTPAFQYKRNGYGHIFWRVVCTSCGCGTWSDAGGFGHMDEDGRRLAALEWNQRI